MTRRLLTSLALITLLGAGCDSDGGGQDDTTPPTSAASEAVDMVVTPSGVGQRSFGDDAEAVIAYVTAVLGDPDEDTGWTDPFSEFGTCSGTKARAVVWGGLQLIFSDDSGGEYAPTGAEQLIGYSLRAGPVTVETTTGIGPGSTVAELRKAHPDAEVFEDDVFGAQATTDDGLWIILTGTADDATVESILGGQGCGE